MSEEFFLHITPKSVPGKKLYCGPTVIAMLTGATREEIFAKVNRRINHNFKKRNPGARRCHMRSLRQPIRGMHNHQIEWVLKSFGVKLSKKHQSASEKYLYGSLRQFAEDFAHVKKPIVVNVTNHYVLFYLGKIYDTYRREGEEVRAHPCAGRRVEAYWIIERQPKREPVVLNLIEKEFPAIPAIGVSINGLPVPAELVIEEVRLNASPAPAEPLPVAPALGKASKSLRARRYAKAKAQAAKWDAKARRAAKLAKKWAAKVKYYERLGIK